MNNDITKKPVAIVSMGCLLPGAENPEQFWSMIRAGRCAWGKIPENRLDRELFFDPKKGVLGKSYSDLAALVDYAAVDPAVTGFSRQELRQCDLAHQAFCRTVVDTLAAGGRSRDALRGQNVGVYVGHSAISPLAKEMMFATSIPQMADFLREVDVFDGLNPVVLRHLMTQLVMINRNKYPHRTAEYNPDLSASSVGGWVARMLGTNGPVMAFNSACASSLQALAHAVKSIQLGRVESAIVGGATFFGADTMVLFSAAQSLSAKGSAPFTQDADGLIVGEGNVCLYLKPLDAAIRDKDTVMGVISGVGISSDGKGKSLWAPRKEGQVEAIRRAYENGVPKETIQYIEGHATSTNLGDQTELQSLDEVFGEALAGKKIPICSVKWNIGHTLEVAGLAGLAKMLLCLKHEEIPPTVEPGKALSTSVDWEKLPFFPPSQVVPWKPSSGEVRRGAVEAFGIGGLNAHAVLDGPEAKEAFLEKNRSVVYPAAAVAGQKVDTVEKSPEIAIVGMGAVLPGSLSVESFWENCLSGKRFLKDIPLQRWNVSLFENPATGTEPISMPKSGVIDTFEYDWKQHKIPPKQIKQASPLQFMMLDAVDQAFRQAGFGEGKEWDHLRTGCVVGASFGGDFGTQLGMGLRLPEVKAQLQKLLAQKEWAPERIEAVLQKFQDKVLEHFPALLDETGSFTASALASRITKSFHLMGGGVAVDAKGNSCAAALSCCVDMLRAGSCNTMVFIGGQQDMTPEMFQSMRYGLLQKLAEEDPFAAPGATPEVLIGEGCVALILKRLEDARRDGDNVLGIVRGIGSAFHPQKYDHGIPMAVKRAVALAGVDFQDVQAVETGGTGIASLDEKEWNSLKSAYGKPAGDETLAIGSVVPYFGNLGRGSGAISLLTAVLSLENEKLPGLVQQKTGAAPLTTAHAQKRLFVGVSGSDDVEMVSHIVVERGNPVNPPIMEKKEIDMPVNPQIIFYDATQRRIQRKRDEALKWAHHAKTPEVAETNVRIPETPEAVAPQPVMEKTATVAVPREELQSFLVNFVMEQTGYPEEIVEMDADLEADLGIDSIKKAQLFGELGEYFSIRPSENLSLDAFPTLRSVLDYLVENQGGSAVTESAPPPAPAVAALAPVMSTPVPAVSAPAPQAVMEETAVVAVPREELQSFLVNFVMEQTGYPEEIVEMDADLEADLGIDSIKKAQLFGELGEYFSIRPSENLSLDAFPTLRSVLDYLVENQGGSAVTAVTTPAPVVSAPAAPAPQPVMEKTAVVAVSREELQSFLVNFVMEQTGYPEEIVEMDADLEADLGIDSIKKAQLFGELGEYFSIRPSENLSLDAFPTLRSVLDYLVENQNKPTA